MSSSLGLRPRGAGSFRVLAPPDTEPLVTRRSVLFWLACIDLVMWIALIYRGQV